MLNQKKVEIFLAKFHKSLAKQFLEVACSRKSMVYHQFHHTRVWTRRWYTVVKMKPGYEKNGAVIDCFSASRCRRNSLVMKIELPHDVDKTASGGNFVAFVSNKLSYNMVDCTMLEGIIHDALWYILRKTFAHQCLYHAVWTFVP